MTWSTFFFFLIGGIKKKSKNQFLLHMWRPSCYYCYTPGDESCMRKGPDCNYDKRKISVIICDADTA